MNTVAVIDYGMGNLHSVAKALQQAGGADRVEVTHDPARIRAADRVVLPGVGAMRDCMGELKRLELDALVREVAASKPLLGICVGMQALMDESAENGGVECLGILPGSVDFFGESLRDPVSGAALKVPHMGWNRVEPSRPHPLWAGIAPGERFYFVHSYYVRAADPAMVAATASHGITFAAALSHENIFAAQFHPEKSQHAGLALYANFLRWNGEAG